MQQFSMTSLLHMSATATKQNEIKLWTPILKKDLKHFQFYIHCFALGFIKGHEEMWIKQNRTENISSKL